MPGQERARALRRDATVAERHLWRHLRDRQLCGHKFRRQHPIGPYVVDFVCIEKCLVVELDGGRHALQTEQDDARTHKMEACGFRVLRFWNHEVLHETDGVLQRIVDILDSEPG